MSAPHQPSAQADGHPGTQTVEERVLDIVADELGLARGTVTPEATFDALGADSLDRIELSIGIEDAFSLVLPDRDAEQLHTVADLVRYVERAVGEPPITS